MAVCDGNFAARIFARSTPGKQACRSSSGKCEPSDIRRRVRFLVRVARRKRKSRTPLPDFPNDTIRCIPLAVYCQASRCKPELYVAERMEKRKCERQTSTGICYSSADTTNNARYRLWRYATGISLREYLHALRLANKLADLRAANANPATYVAG